MNYNHYASFIYDAFNYLNGKVNKINIANNLYIGNDETGIFGATSAGIVEIYLSNILKIFHPEEERIVKTIIIEVLAHELVHLDQVIDYPKYENDVGYRNDIETQTNAIAYAYLLNNNVNILRDLTMCFDYDLILCRSMQIKTYVPYQRIDLEHFYDTTVRSILANYDVKAYSNILIRVMHVDVALNEFLVKWMGEYNDDTWKMNNIVNLILDDYSQPTVAVEMNYSNGGSLWINIKLVPSKLISPIRR